MIRILARLWPLLLALAMLPACSDERDVARIDFTKSISETRTPTGVDSSPRLRCAVSAMVSPKETHTIYVRLMDYLAKRLDMDLEFVQRKTYAEVNELLMSRDLDVAMLCSGPFALAEDQLGVDLVATPVLGGSPFYQAYLIVGADNPAEKLADLRGSVFAFTDPDSNTGRLVPLHWLAEIGETPESFFAETIFTYSHDNSVLAVARGLVDAASVDGLVWDYMAAHDPELVGRTRIIKKSQEFGAPPVVASLDLPAEKRQALREMLLAMHEDPEGREILDGLHIDRFTASDPAWYEAIREISRPARVKE